MRILFLALFFSLGAYAQQAYTIHCNYVFMVMPTADITLDVAQDGQLATSALIKMGAGDAGHKETITPEVLAPGEMIHAWISKEKPENTIEMIVYNQVQPQGHSKLTNHNVPFAQDMWGTCEIQ